MIFSDHHSRSQWGRLHSNTGRWWPCGIPSMVQPPSGAVLYPTWPPRWLHHSSPSELANSWGRRPDMHQQQEHQIATGNIISMGWVQDCSISIANALELLQSCSKLIYSLSMGWIIDYICTIILIITQNLPECGTFILSCASHLNYLGPDSI